MDNSDVHIEMYVDAILMTVCAYITFSTTASILASELDIIQKMVFVSMTEQTAYIDNIEYQLLDGTYKAVDITARDSERNVAELQFTLYKKY